MGRVGRGGEEGEAGQGRLGGADWSKCEVGRGEVRRVVSNALSSWQIGLCWFASILKALLKVESRRRMVLVLPLQRAASNNDTLPSLSLLSGVPPGLKWSAVARGHVVELEEHFVPAGALEGCSGPKKVGKRETMEEDGAHRQAPPPGNLPARKQGCDQPGSGGLLQVGVLNPTQL